MTIVNRHRVFSGMLALALAVTGLPAVAASPADAATAALTVTVDCFSSRERTTIKNNRSATVTIKTVGSLYKPYSNEPFAVNRQLGAGKTLIFFTGSGASASNSNTLTRRNIYNNSVAAEGARVTSSVGTFKKFC